MEMVSVLSRVVALSHAWVVTNRWLVKTKELTSKFYLILMTT